MMFNLLMRSQNASTAALHQKDHRRFLFEWLGLTFFAVALLIFRIFFEAQFPFGNILYDQIQAIKNQPPSNKIIIVEIDDRSIAELGGWPINRSAYSLFLKNLADSGNYPAAIGFDILFIDSTTSDQSFSDQIVRHRVVLPAEIRFDKESGRTQSKNPPPLLASVATQIAQINVTFDDDGVIRGTRLVEAGVPHLSLALSNQPPDAKDISEKPYRRFTLKNPKAGFTSISLSDAMKPGYPLSIFKDKYVFIGATAPSLGDHYPSIYSGKEKTGTPGVIFQASLLEDILNNELITISSTQYHVWLSIVGLMLVLLGMLMLSPSLDLLLTLIVITISLVGSFLSLWKFNHWFDPMPMITVILLAKLTWAWRRMSMIASFIVSRTRDLQTIELYPQERQRFSFTKDAILQYSSILDAAINATRSRMENFGKIINKLPEAMLVLNQSNQILLANEKFRTQFYDKEISLSITLDNLLESWNVTHQDIENSLTSPVNQKHLTIKDGREIENNYILHRVDYLLDDQTKLYLLMFVDVTDLLTFQHQRDRTLQLLSHDMRTPVASLLTITRSMKVVDIDVNQNKSFINKINFHSKRLLSMMDDFILSIRADANQYKLETILFENLLDDSVHHLNDLSKDKSMRIAITPSTEPLFIHVDNRLMERTLINLIANAIRHGEKGTVIEISTRLVQENNGPHVHCLISNEVSVEQDSEEIQNDEERGFGLGLDFVDQVIRKHQGHITRHFPDSDTDKAWVLIELPLVEMVE